MNNEDDNTQYALTLKGLFCICLFNAGKTASIEEGQAIYEKFVNHGAFPRAVLSHCVDREWIGSKPPTDEVEQ